MNALVHCCSYFLREVTNHSLNASFDPSSRTETYWGRNYRRDYSSRRKARTWTALASLRSCQTVPGGEERGHWPYLLDDCQGSAYWRSPQEIRTSEKEEKPWSLFDWIRSSLQLDRKRSERESERTADLRLSCLQFTHGRQMTLTRVSDKCSWAWKKISVMSRHWTDDELQFHYEWIDFQHFLLHDAFQHKING